MMSRKYENREKNEFSISLRQLMILPLLISVIVIGIVQYISFINSRFAYLEEELETVKSGLKQVNKQVETVTERVNLIEPEKPRINLAQIFVTFGEEQGKGNIVQIPRSGGLVFQEEIAECQNCTSASYSLYAARYAQSNMDRAIVIIYIYTSQGRYETTHNLTQRVQNYSQMTTDNMTLLRGNIPFQGTPTRVELRVIPGDWAVEIQDFQLQFE